MLLAFFMILGKASNQMLIQAAMAQETNSETKEEIQFAINESSDTTKEEYDQIEDCASAGIFVLKEKTIYTTSRQGQEFHLPENPETILFGAAGSTFKEPKNRKDAVILQHGRLLAMTGRFRNFDLLTNFGEVEVPKATYAIVQYTPEGILRIENLLGNSLTLTFRIGYRPYALTAAKGDEICIIADEEFDPKLLVPNDGVERESTDCYYIPGCQIQRHRFDQKMFVERDDLISSTAGASPEAIERIRALKKKVRPLPRSKGMMRERQNSEQLAIAPRRRKIV